MAGEPPGPILRPRGRAHPRRTRPHPAAKGLKAHARRRPLPLFRPWGPPLGRGLPVRWSWAMIAESTRRFEALEAQAQRLMAVFTRAGYEHVAPSIMQPANMFLDVVGDSLRARTYVFSDPDGEELCLRPDLTVPTCRLHLARHPAGAVPARYCYNGSAFRYQPGGDTHAHPREIGRVHV